MRIGFESEVLVGVVGDGFQIRGLVGGLQRRRRGGKAREIRLDIEPDDEAPVRREQLRNMRSEVNPAAITARHNDRSSVGHAVQVD